MVRGTAGGIKGIWRELRHTARRGVRCWRLVPWRHRCALAGALLVMCLASAATRPWRSAWASSSIRWTPRGSSGPPAGRDMRIAAVYLGMIGLAYLLRESMNVLRRFLVERTCTRINKDMCVRLVGHLMKVDLSIAGPGPGRGPVRADHPRLRRLREVPADQLPRLRARPS